MSLEQLPSLELLEANHSFPGRYMFKVVGWTDDEFEQRVLNAATEVLQTKQELIYSIRRTGTGRHVSVTIEPHVISGFEVLNVYRRMKTLDGLIMLW